MEIMLRLRVQDKKSLALVDLDIELGRKSLGIRCFYSDGCDFIDRHSTLGEQTTDVDLAFARTINPPKDSIAKRLSPSLEAQVQ